jgi:hypothetical protein
MMASYTKEKLSDLQKWAKENISIAEQTVNIIQQYIDEGKEKLIDITNGKDFFIMIAFLNAQKKAPKIEDFIRNKLQHNSVKKKWNKGDGEKDGEYYEYKISTTNENEQLNALQIRLWQEEIKYYLLGYIDEQQFDNSRLYLVPKDKMKKLCAEYGTPTHPKDADYDIEKVEMTLRMAMKPKNEKGQKLFSDLEQNYRATDLEKIVFN